MVKGSRLWGRCSGRRGWLIWLQPPSFSILRPYWPLLCFTVDLQVKQLPPPHTEDSRDTVEPHKGNCFLCWRSQVQSLATPVLKYQGPGQVKDSRGPGEPLPVKVDSTNLDRSAPNSHMSLICPFVLITSSQEALRNLLFHQTILPRYLLVISWVMMRYRFGKSRCWQQWMDWTSGGHSVPAYTSHNHQ